MRFNPNERILHWCKMCDVEANDDLGYWSCSNCNDYDGIVQKTASLEVQEYPHELMMKSYEKSTYAWQPDMTDKILRVTKSSVGNFDWCPQQYYFSNILGMRGEEQDYHVRGSNVHDAVEYWWRAMKHVVQDVYDLIEKGEKDRALTMCIDTLAKPPEPYIHGEVEQLHLYVKWQFERLCNCERAEIKDWFPVGNEAEVHGTRMVVASDGTEVAIHMKGYIDRMFLDDDKQGIILMELKTGKWNKYKPSAMRAEMQFYRMMLEHSPHMEFLPVVGWGWQFPGGGINGGDGPKWDYESVRGPGGRYAPKTVEKRLKRLVDAHLAMDFPPDKNERKCSYCDFFEHCPAWMDDYTVEVDQ